MDKPTICVDFDGVLHSYSSGWARDAPHPEEVIRDDPVAGAMAWLVSIRRHYKVAIYSARSDSTRGRLAMKKWVRYHLAQHLARDGVSNAEARAKEIRDELDFPASKPPATIYLDDRAVCFTGTFPTAAEIADFKPWHKK